MVLSKKYLLEEGKEAPEGTVVCTCKTCKQKFAIPENEAKDIKDDSVCETCAEAIDKAAAAAASSMVTGGSEEAIKTLNAALGTDTTTDSINKAIGN